MILCRREQKKIPAQNALVIFDTKKKKNLASTPSNKWKRKKEKKKNVHRTKIPACVLIEVSKMEGVANE